MYIICMFTEQISHFIKKSISRNNTCNDENESDKKDFSCLSENIVQTTDQILLIISLQNIKIKDINHITKRLGFFIF